MNASHVFLSPRIAMFNGAIALLPSLSPRPLSKILPEERKALLAQAVSMARELMKMCDYGENALTIADLNAAVSVATEVGTPGSKPEWIRMPTKGRCPFTGLGRSFLYTLVTPCEANRHHPPVRSISLRRRGYTKGVRLIHLRSLLDYLESHAETQ
jgi:hypothetical protein